MPHQQTLKLKYNIFYYYILYIIIMIDIQELDPIKFYNINENNYDKKFIDLFKHIIKLINTNCIEIKKITQEIQKPIITYEIPISSVPSVPSVPIVPSISSDDKLRKLKAKIKELGLQINDLNKIYVELYNNILRYTNNLNTTIQNLNDTLEAITKSSSSVSTSESKKIKPLSYRPLDISKIDNLNLENTIIIAKKYIAIINELNQKIHKLLNKNKELKEKINIKQITKNIRNLIAPIKTELKVVSPPQYGGKCTTKETPMQCFEREKREKREKKEREMATVTTTASVSSATTASPVDTTASPVDTTASPAVSAAPVIPPTPKIEDVYDDIMKIRKLINGITQLNVDVELPSTTTLKIDDAEKNLLILQNNLEKMTLEYEKNNNKNPLEQKYGLNMFEQMPSYKGLPSQFTQEISNINKTSDLPPQGILLEKIDIIESGINKQKENYNTQTQSIKNLYNEIVDFVKKIKEYKETEIKKNTKQDIVYPYSNVGLISDIDTKINELKQIKLEKEKDIPINNELIDILKSNKDYINKKLENENIQIDEYKTEILNLIEELTTFQEKFGAKNTYKIDLNTFDDYFKELKETDIKSSTQVAQPARPSYQLPKQKQQAEQKTEPITSNKIMPNYEDGLFLKFDVTKDNNIIKLLENKNFNEVYKLLKDLRETINHVSDKKITLTRPTTQKYANIFNIINITSSKEKSSQLKNINKFFDKEDTKPLYKLKNLVKSQEEFTETPELLNKYNKLKQKNIDFTKLDETLQNYENLNQTIQQELIVIDRQIEELERAKTNISPDDLKISNAFDLNMTNYNKIIIEFKMYIYNINNKITTLLSESASLKEPKILETESKWLNKTGGGIVEDFNNNLDNINNITKLNDKIRELMIIIENYKSVVTDLINKYNEFIREAYNILVYLTYKLTAFFDVKNNKIQIDKKFNETILNELKNKISNNNRKNFIFIKELYVNVINDIINKLKISGKKFIDYKSYTNKEALINIIVLLHLNKYIDNI